MAEPEHAFIGKTHHTGLRVFRKNRELCKRLLLRVISPQVVVVCIRYPDLPVFVYGDPGEVHSGMKRYLHNAFFLCIDVTKRPAVLLHKPYSPLAIVGKVVWLCVFCRHNELGEYLLYRVEAYNTVAKHINKPDQPVFSHNNSARVPDAVVGHRLLRCAPIGRIIFPVDRRKILGRRNFVFLVLPRGGIENTNSVGRIQGDPEPIRGINCQAIRSRIFGWQSILVNFWKNIKRRGRKFCYYRFDMPRIGLLIPGGIPRAWSRTKEQNQQRQKYKTSALLYITR